VRLALCLALLSLCLQGCANQSKARMDPGSRAEDDLAAGGGQGAALMYDAAESAPASMPMQKSAPAPRKMRSAVSQPAPPSAAYEPPEPMVPAPNQTRSPASKRMVHYSGDATLRSTEPEKVLDSAIALVQAAGGYLERRSTLQAALRVPAERFDSLFHRLMRLGEVVNYSQQAEDITEAFQDVEMRLRIVVATLERLEDLVRKAKTENQKLTLMRELRRLREEKEVLESGRRELVQRARFASIQLWLQEHTPLVGGELAQADLADFRWIHRLTPFDEKRFQGRSTLRFQAPGGMVVTRKGSAPWRATSSRGSEFWGTEMDVEPRGDSRFWMEAIRTRLKDGFKAVEEREAGAFRLCRFQSYGPSPYFYWVGVRSRGSEIDIAEFYFPDADQQDALLPGILAAVERKSK